MAKVTSSDRDKSGGGKGMKPGSFPVETKAQQESAIKLRGHAPDPSAVLDKVARKTGDEAMKARIAAARKKDSNG